MFGKKGKAATRGDEPVRQKGDQKAPSPAPSGVNKTASKHPSGTKGNRNLPR